MEIETKETQELVAPDESESKSRFADYVAPDGRRWDQLTTDEKAKVRKKFKKKNQTQLLKEKAIEMTASLQKAADSKAKPENPDEVEKESKSILESQIRWCTAQIRLGLTNNNVTKDQCRFGDSANIQTTRA